MSRHPRPPVGLSPLPTAIPDRSLDPTGDLPVVSVRAAGNHPFVYRKMIIGPAGAARASDGDLVRVVDRDNIPIGFGLWNSRSQITLRLLSPGVNAPGSAFWRERIGRAVALRRDML